MKARYLAAFAAVIFSSAALAVPALRKARTVTQPDGSTVVVRVVGDEFLHYMLTEDGDVITLGDDGFYYMAAVSADGATTPTRVRVTAPAAQKAAVAVNIADVPAGHIQSARRSLKSPGRKAAPRAAAAQDNPYSGLGLFTSTFPRTGDIRSCVILVQYSDVSFTLSDPADYFTDMLNGENFTQYNGTGSARKYFMASSMNRFRPTFDVLGPVTLPQKRSYYGGNDAYGNDQRPEYMLVHALQALDPSVDFSKYDMDNDGYLDNIFIIYAGQGEASYGSAETVWPHSWTLSAAGISLSVDGKRVDTYGCTNEWEINKPDGVGTFVHEFSHVIGLPDLYTTDYTAAMTETPGSYSVLDMGPYNNDGRTPPIYSAYERNALGWLEPEVLDGTPTSLSLEHIEKSDCAALIPTSKSNEFFLLENRQTDGWDRYIPGHGMLVWHIQFDQKVYDDNVVNNTSGHQYVDIIEANSNPNNESETAMAGYTFPGTKNVTALDNTTKVALKLWDGSATDVALSEIAEDPATGTISFNVNGGADPIPAPELSEPAEIAPDYFTASWQSVEGATDYLLRVRGIKEGVSESETADMGSAGSFALPDGWSSSSTQIYVDAKYCPGAAPAYKMNKNGSWLQTRNFEGEISKVSFATRGNGIIGSTLSVLAKDASGDWTDIAVIDPANSTVTTTLADEIPAGTHAIKFVYNKTTGNLAIDDVTVTSGASDFVLPGFNFVSTGGSTRMRVPAVDGVKTYFYTVRAVDETRRSPLPDVEIMVTLPTQGIGDISADDADTPVLWYNLQGICLGSQRPVTPGLYICRTATSARIVKI